MAANASLILTCTQSSQDIANNKSTVSIKVVCQLKNGVAFSNAGIKTTVSVTCDGQTKSFAAPTSYDVGANGSLTLGSVSFTVSHASDGVKSISYSASWTPPYLYGGGTATGSGSKTLTTIPRASTISSVSGSTLGSAVTVNISRKASNFTHTVTYKFGSITRSYTGQTTACTFTPPLSDASAIPNASSGTATVTVQTMSGSTKIGSVISKTFTLNLPASVVPSISGPAITRVDNGVPSAWGIYVKGFSKANVNISGSGIYGSSISSYSISGGGYSSTSSSLSSGVLNTAGTITFTGTVKDSRNRTKSAPVSVTVYDYQVPTVSLNAERCNSDGSINPDGVYVKITASFSISSVNGKNNVASKKIEVVGTSYSKNDFTSGNSEVLGGAISIDKTYIVKATITDTLGKTSTSQVSIPTGEVVLDFKSNGKGVAFGKVAETDRLLDSAWGMQCASLNVTSPDWGAITSSGTIFTPAQVQINNGGWIGPHMFSNGWIGFYNAIGGTRKGWIGHDGSNNLYINNSAGGSVVISGASLLVKNDASLMGYTTSGGTAHLIGVSSANNIYVGDSGNGSKSHGSTNIYGCQNIMFQCHSGASHVGYQLHLSREQSGSLRTILRGNTNGNLWLGSTSYRWNTAFFTNTITASDLKEKDVLTDFDMKAKDFIMALEPIAYKRKGSGDTGKRIHYGFGAQTVAKILELLDIGDLSMVQASIVNSDGTESPYIKGTPDERVSWGLNYNEFIAPIVATVQYHQKEIENLNRKINKLENLIDELIKKIE